ncbi:MAG: hypothetical protein Q9227_006804 [Pyrenula ochraceoflavens]
MSQKISPSSTLPFHEKNTITRRHLTSQNPLPTGIERFLLEYPDLRDLFTHPLPKHYTVHPPLLLLPSTPPWPDLLRALPPDLLSSLLSQILSAFTPKRLTHAAINAPIPLHTSSSFSDGSTNHVRTPTGLVPIYGDFGPRDCSPTHPSLPDLARAFWVHGPIPGRLIQVYAPLHTMFSRGNVREKERILRPGGMEGLDGVDGRLGQRHQDIAVVDLYVGVGYFALCYLKRGVGKVWGWDLSGWSIEGARRGANGCGWKAETFEPEVEEGERIERVLTAMDDKATRLLLFHEENERALHMIREVRERCINRKEEDRSSWKAIRHVNLGLLPSSQSMWEAAVHILDAQRGGWVHAHENVGMNVIEQRKREVETLFEGYLVSRGDSGDKWMATCEHVEQVKTYAPGVMHCVFDVHVAPVDPQTGE